MNYYAEIWLRGYAKDYVRSLETADEKAHPHITLVRPFKVPTLEGLVKEQIIRLCQKQSLIPFTISGKGSFEKGKIKYFPVQSQELLAFDEKLERTLDFVDFAEKLNPQKILHVHVNTKQELPLLKKIPQYMLRLTMIKNKKIWFSYDFVTQEVLNRKQSLNQKSWYQTVHQFSEKYDLLPTRQGFQEI